MYSTPLTMRMGGGWGAGKSPETFIHSNTSAKMLHARPRKMKEAAAREKNVWSSARKPGPRSLPPPPSPPRPGRQHGGPADRESGCAPALPRPCSPALRSRFRGRRGRTSRAGSQPGHLGKTEAHGFSSSRPPARPPPGPWPLPGRRDLQSKGGSASSTPEHLRRRPSQPPGWGRS